MEEEEEDGDYVDRSDADEDGRNEGYRDVGVGDSLSLDFSLQYSIHHATRPPKKFDVR
jgi:hypothetical protein